MISHNVEPGHVEILIVDDEEEMRKFIMQVLNGPFVFRFAESGEEAIKTVEKYRPDIIVSDYKMARGSGIDLLEYLKEKLIDIPFIFVTGFSDKRVAIQALKLGAFDFVEKPFEPAEINAAVKRAYSFVILRRENVEAKARSFEAEKLAAIGLMAGSIVHEVSNPIAALMGRLEKLKRVCNEEKVGPLVTDLVGQCADTVLRTIRLIKSIRNVFGARSEHPEFVSIYAIIDDALSICQDRFAGGGITFSQIREAPDCLVFCDRVEVAQGILNLIINAIHAVEEQIDKEIELKVTAENNTLKISIIDSGDGVANDIRAKIFEPFFTTKKLGKGTGLGLSTSRRLFQRNGGELRLDEERTLGAKFDIYLPIPPK